MVHNLQNENIWLNVDKPPHISSARAVAIVKRVTKAKKVGHGGTLDPFASGVLPIALNKATKTSQLMMDGIKEYMFCIKWGEFRDTDDIEGNIVKSSAARPKNYALSLILTQFIGEIEQEPSKFSAIKINGKRAYDLARKGVEFTMPKRHIKIYQLTLISNSQQEAWFRVRCSKGTYIRTLCHDICKNLGVCGYVSFLRRQKVGDFSVDRTISLDWLKYNITNSSCDVSIVNSLRE